MAFAAPIAISATGSNASALNQGGMPAVAPDGSVYVVWGQFNFSTNSQQILLVRSTNGGDMFTNPDPSDTSAAKTIASATMTVGNLVSDGINVRTRGFPYIVVDHTPPGSPTRGNIYVVYQADPDDGGADRANVFFTRSTDGGQSWSSSRSINSGPAVTVGPDTGTNDNWQPQIAVSPSTGQITVIFYDRRDDTGATDGDPANTRIRVYKTKLYRQMQAIRG